MTYRNLLLAALISSAGIFGYSQPEGNPGLALQGPDHYSFEVGDVKVTALSDGSVPQDLHILLRGTTEAKTDALLQRSFLTNPVEASINAFLFRTEDRLVLVDTGAGEFFGPGFGDKLLSSLAAVGVAPDQITDVLLTHAHDDHMGGLVHGGKLTFPNATVHLSKADLDFFMDRENAKRTGYAMSYFDQASTALEPCIKAGKVKAFTSDGEVAPGVFAAQHPGHTPGTTFYTLRSRGEEIVFIGDIIHVAAVQAPDPEITIAYDVNPAAAAAVRREALSTFAEERTLVAVPHLSFPGVGHFRRMGSGFEWVPIAYGNREPGSDGRFADPHKNGDKH
ncbi:MBL fold metallo-hydrolase [Acidobacteria bacterium AB60]|nr:MBL fold metallo-hydrolase [Acidobacteria bacterium AB60]